MNKLKAQVIAFYLPQFHPMPENDVWWGKGFTEWTNVGKASKLFPGHYQPRVPADLGYYDLRIPEVREAQAELAKEAGVAAFCYWHYWFGNGKQLLEKPLQEVIKTGKPDFPFCLGWANHHWKRNNWSKDVSRFNSEYLIKVEYPGLSDIDNHFYAMLPMFSDSRYYKVNGKLLFCIYAVEELPDYKLFINRWQELAVKNNLPEFYFVLRSQDVESLSKECYTSGDAVILDLKSATLFKGNSVWRKRFSYLMPFPINTQKYKNAIKHWEHPLYKEPRIFPTIYPNWDNSPRVGKSALILHHSTPELFAEHVKNTLALIEHKDTSDKIVFLRSWNEWAEGNYMEPDIKFGKGYINALRKAIEA